jgi:hypothetical protein
VALVKKTFGQVAITAISTSSSNTAIASEVNINGAGYVFSQWATANTFNVNYASAATGDITSISSFNTSALIGLQPVTLTAVAKVQRVANATIPDTRNFITSWNKISSAPAALATNGTFDCIAPKVTAMETALLTNNINSGYDNLFQNTTSNPHYNNIERVDYIIPGAISVPANLSQVGFAVFDRGTGDDFKIAAITSIDASNNPTGYGSLISVTAANFSAAGLLGTAFDYAIFVSDPGVAGGQHRPSVRNTQDIRGVFISLQILGIAANQKIYGYSLFGPDVLVPTHTLTNPATFPTNTNSASMLDLVNVMGLFKTSIVTVVPLKLTSFTAVYENNMAKLNWVTSFEQNLLNFIIEKSYDGLLWEQLGIVTAKNEILGSQYHFNDINVFPGKNYYRLKMVNTDGSAEYSGIKLISANKTGITVIKYDSYSNKIIVSSNKPVLAITILSSAGQRIQYSAVPGNVTATELYLKKMPPGIYFIRMEMADASSSPSKIVVN